MNSSTNPNPRPAARFTLFVAASKLHDPQALRRITRAYTDSLRALGAQDWEPGAAPPRVVFVATGGTERQVLDCGPFDAREPLLIVAHPGHNSLPAALEVLARLQQTGVRGRIFYVRGSDDADAWRQLAGAIGDGTVRRALIESRIGLVGEPSDWLVASSPAAGIVRSVWGPTVVPISLETILSEPDAQAATAGDAVARDFHREAAALVEPAESDLPAAGRVHALLRRVVDAERLDAVAVRCFDLVVRRRTTGCIALAQLNDEGTIAGCEGDLVATVAMLWLHRMLGQVPWMANPSRVDLDRGVLSLAHCTVPRSLGRDYRLRSHFESGLGVGVQGTLPTGPVTLVRLGGARVELLRALDGELVRNTDHADLCRTQVEVEIGRAALEDLLVRPLGNHMVMVFGHHAAVLRRWHEAMIV